jgi:uncharacterized protein YjdB
MRKNIILFAILFILSLFISPALSFAQCTITGTNPMCNTATETLDVGTGGTATESWTSTNTLVATVTFSTSTGMCTITGVAPGTVKIIYDDGSGTNCAIMMTLDPTPTAGPISGTLAFCTGNTSLLSQSGTPGGIWSSSLPGVASVSPGTGLVSGLLPGNSTITYSVSNSCPLAHANAIVTINPTPGAGIINGATTVCVGANTPLSESLTGGSWTSSNTLVATVGPVNGRVVGVSAGTVTISYAVMGAFCTGYAVYSMTVLPLANAGTLLGPAGICVGSTAGINVIGGLTGGTWSSSNNAIGTIDASTGSAGGISVGVVTFSYTVSNICGLASATITLPIGNYPGVIAGPSDVCVGATIPLTESITGGGWTSSAPLTATVDPSSGIVGGITGGTANIIYTLPTFCGTATVSWPVTVTTGLPTVAVITPVSANVCVGSNLAMTDATTGGTWTSGTPANGTVDAASGVVTGILPGTTVLSYAVTNGCGTTTVTQNVNVNALPAAPAAIGGSTFYVCTGSTIAVTDAVTGGVWSTGGLGFATVTSGGVVTGVTAGTEIITYTTTLGSCSLFVTQNVYVNPLPGAPGTIGGTFTICAGAGTTLTDGPSGGVWSSGSTGIATIGAGSGLVTGVAIGTALMAYTVTDGYGCTAAATQNVTVIALPAVSPIGGTLSVCAGLTTTLTDATGGGTWASSNTAVATITSGGVVTGVAAGSSAISYTVTGTGGCTATAVSSVAVNALPNAGSIFGTFDVCTGATTPMNDVGDPGGTWTSSNITFATVAASTGVVSGVSAGNVNITYTVTSGAGCTAFTTYAMTVNATNPGTITGTFSVCQGSDVILTNPTGDPGSWTSSTPAIANADLYSGDITGMAPGSVTLTYTTLSGWCPASTTHTFTVNPLPNPGVISSTSFLVCPGLTTTLSVTGSSGVVSHSWASLNPLYAPITSPGGVVSGLMTGTSLITYTGTNTFGCSASVTQTVTVQALPAIGTISGIFQVCASGGTAPLFASPAGGAWSTSSALLGTVSTGGIITGIAAGTPTITYTITGASCNAFTTQQITVNALPTTPAGISGTTPICKNLTQVFTDPTIGGTWSSSIPGIAQINTSGTVTGIFQGAATISYTFTNTAGCKISAIKAITINPLPLAPAAITGPNICVGSTGTLGNTTGGGAWTSGNPALATIVSGTGVITGVAVGSAPISYTTTLVGGTVTCSLTVSTFKSIIAAAAITGVTFSVCPPNGVGGGASILLTGSPASGTWSSSVTAVGTVLTMTGTTGNVTAISSGTTIITYTLPGCTATHPVTVSPLNFAPGVVYITATVPAMGVSNNGTGTSHIPLSTPIIFNYSGSTTFYNHWSNINPPAWVTSPSSPFNMHVSFKATSAGTDTLWYYVTDGTGCIDATHITVICP